MSIEDKRIFRLTAKEPFTGALVPNLKEKESHPLRSSVWLFFISASLAEVNFARCRKRKKPPTFVDGLLTILVVGDEGFEPPTPCL